MPPADRPSSRMRGSRATGLRPPRHTFVNPMNDSHRTNPNALLGMPWFEVFTSLTLGKGVKYGVMAALTAKTADQAIEYYGQNAGAVAPKRGSSTEGH